MIKIVKEEVEEAFQNEWNDIINAIHQINPKTNKGRILKGKLEKMCYSFIKEVNGMNESKKLVAESVTFDTAQYEGSHMKKPRGTGCWCFSTKRRPDDSDNNSVVFTLSMSYAEANNFKLKIKIKGI